MSTPSLAVSPAKIWTAQLLVRQLGLRMQEFLLAHANSGALQTTLIDPALRQYLPQDINPLNAWVTASDGADALNLGLERRASAWTQSNATAVFYSPGWPVPPVVGSFEFHFRFQRAQILEAINDGVGQLGLTWFREVTDESLVTADKVWQYAPPATQFWSNIQKLEIQSNTDPTLTGYPFVSADYLNWRARRQVDPNGLESWFIDFGILPPPGRTLRVYGEAYYPELAVDTDVLALAGEWQRPALAWIFAWAAFNLNDWTTNATVSTEVEKIRQKSLDQLQRQKDQLLATAPPHKPGRIITPGRGDAQPAESPEDGSYLGVFKSSGYNH